MCYAKDIFTQGALYMNKIVNPHSHLMQIMRETEPKLAYKNDMPFEQWREIARAKLSELLRMDKFERCPSLFDIESETDRDTFTDIRFTFQSEEGYFVPCHFCVPKGAAGPLPIVICVQGHSTGMHQSLGEAKYEGDAEGLAGDRDYAVQAVAQGYCALVLEQRNFGECGGTPKGPDCYHSDMTALLLGRTTAGARVWDIMRSIDIIEARFPQADAKKIALTGNSGGGTATFYTACLEDRLAAAMPSCAVCTYDDSIGAMRHCSCNYVPGVREYFNMGDLAGLIAPKPLIIAAGRHDGIFPYDGVLKSYETALRMYAAAGADGNCALVTGEEGHRFYAEESWPVFNRLTGWN